MNAVIVPPIYVRLDPPRRTAWLGRLLCFAIGAASLAVLLTAASIDPSLKGYGTHTQLGLQPCAFLERTGIPCAGCGMTTSFAWLVRGNIAASFYTQPFGMVLGLLTVLGAWSGFYLAWTGKPAYRLLADLPMRYYVLPGTLLALGGWAWKIALHVSGHEGWS